MITILFARRDSVYKTLPGVDVWDADRDALRWPGGTPIVAHPPCRAWGRLRHFARPAPGERELARWAVLQVQQWGGVLEHPASSLLWLDAGLPDPGAQDEFGGWTLPITQHWWGHRARKVTWLYIFGCAPSDLPPIPIRLDEPTHVIATGHGMRKGMPGYRKHCTKAEREHTPILLAQWLVEVAQQCSN